MEYLFVTTSHDYADEFDMGGTFTIEKNEFDEQMALIEKAFESGVIDENTEFYFGTNEALTFYDFYDFKCGVKVKPCSKAFHDEFFELTAGGGVGEDIFWRITDYINDRLNEAKEDEE